MELLDNMVNVPPSRWRSSEILFLLACAAVSATALLFLGGN